MYPICFWLMIAVGIVAEKLVTLSLWYPPAPQRFMGAIRMAVLDRDLPHAIRVCSGSRSPLARVLRAGLEVSAHSAARVQAEMDRAWLEIHPRLRARVSFLPVLANLAILSGLLGTITGMIKSPGCCCGCDPSQKARMLAEGISEAMNCTAFGLAVAILCAASHALFCARIDSIAHQTLGESLHAIRLARSLAED